MKRRVRLRIGGRVQGVAYRASARDYALGLGLVGWIRNLPDGAVEGIAEGEASAVDAFVAWCHEGPPGARVDRVDVADEQVAGELSRFEIRR